MENQQIEWRMAYERGEELRELLLIRAPGAAPKLASAIFDAKTYPNGDPLQLVELDMDEVDKRLDFLLGLKEAGLLQAS